MSGRIVKCTNEDGVEVVFSYKADARFFLKSITGVTTVKNKIATSANTTVDGSTYQGSVTQERNIVIVAEMDANSSEYHQDSRDLLYSCFKPKAWGTLEFTEGSRPPRIIKYKAETIECDNDDGPERFATISLICPDPLFQSQDDIVVTMAGWDSGFEWIHEFLEEGEEFGERKSEIVKTIENDSAADYIGIEIDISATGAVTNPAMYHEQQAEHIQIGTSVDPFVMQAGDKLKITTGTNEKDVVLIRGGVEKSVNEYMDENSEYIQLIHGKNTFTYAADSGRDYMDVSIIYRLRYLGV